MSEIDGCRVCGLIMAPGAGSRVRLYCSEPCKNRAKWERRKSVYHAELAAGVTPRLRKYQNDRYHRMGGRSRYTGTVESCRECAGEFEGMLGKVYCTVTCREAAADRRERERAGRAEVLLGATASLFGAYFPKPKKIKAWVTVGVMAICPWCEANMTATSLTNRLCRQCGTTAELNQEEVEWVTSEKRLTKA